MNCIRVQRTVGPSESVGFEPHLEEQEGFGEELLSAHVGPCSPSSHSLPSFDLPGPPHISTDGTALRVEAQGGRENHEALRTPSR